jgi:hypothetical protein
VEVPDDTPTDTPDNQSLRELVDELRARVAAQGIELEARRREVQELHVLLQQAQAALPAPVGTRRPWWRFWQRS